MNFIALRNLKAIAKFATTLIGVCACLMLNVFDAQATHSSGSDLTYRWISGNTFEVSVSFYRDCAGVAAPSSVTLRSRSASCSRDFNTTLNQVSGTGQEITFPCSTSVTKCSNSASIYPGYQKYEYRGNVTLPVLCTDWIFSYAVCCRNCAITTINNPCGGSSDMYVEATLNNLAAPTNSSPTFTILPVAFICTNQSFTYNHGVTDPNGDSLVYQFVTPQTSSGPVVFNAGYSTSQFLTSAPAITLNSSTGDIVINATTTNEVGVTAMKVSEYRNGVLIGSVVRDMQFRTQLCNPNVLPTATGINGTTDFDIYVCPGNTANFNVLSNDANAGQSVIMSWNNAVPGATFTTSGSPFPTGTFNWTPTLANARSQPYQFIVTVRDNNCPMNGFQNYSYQVYVPLIAATTTASNYNGFNVSCFNGNNGTSTVSPSGGVAPYTYSWSTIPIQTTVTATGLSMGTYNVTVTDANGCPKMVSQSITQPTQLLAGVSASTNVNCNGGNNGTATVATTGGVPGYTYSWNSAPVQTTLTATGLTANNYVATVTDLNGCTDTALVTISQPAVLANTLDSAHNVSCNGQNDGDIYLTVTGGTAPYTYLWSTSATTQDLIDVGAGTYSVTITDSKGCISTRTVTITQPGSVVPNISSGSIGTTNISCNGGNDGTATINVSGGTMPYTYVWSNGQTTQTATGFSAGTATVTITDANGCSALASTTLTEPDVLSTTIPGFSVYFGGVNVSCFGATDGSVDLEVNGGTAPYSYSWDNGDTTQDLTNVPAGPFICTVTDANGCTTTESITLTQPALINPSVFSPVNAGGYNIGCRGENSGSIDLTVVGGTAPFSYIWSSGQMTQDINQLYAGFYDVNITDVNGCLGYDSITLIEPDTVVPLITSATINGSNISCAGGNDGTAYVTVSGGTPPYNYLWSTSSTNDTVYNILAGDIAVYVTDQNGCSEDATAILIEPLPLNMLVTTSNFNGFNVSCAGSNDGNIDLTVGGGTSPYQYLWNTSDTTQDISGVIAGNYSVVITDLNNCKDTVPVTMVEPDGMTTSSVLSDYLGYNISCNGGSNGSIDLTVAGGIAGYSFSWTSGDFTEDVSGLSFGSYQVTITDQNGCTHDTTVTLNEPTPVLTTDSISDYFGFGVSCSGYTDGIAYAVGSGGVPGYTYSWSTGATSDTAYGLGAGTYNYSVTDSNGCVAAGSVTLNQPTPINVTDSISTFNGYGISCYGLTNACINITASGGVAPYHYEWSDETYDEDLCNLGAGSFWVIVTDTNGCARSDTFNITGPDSIQINNTTSSYTNGYNISCNGFNNGNIDLTMVGGVAPFSFTWSTTDTTEDIASLIAGTYTVSITDANGCTSTDTFDLTEPTPVTSSTSSIPTSCGVNNGVAQVVAAGGDGPYSYAWNSIPIQNTDSATGLAAGQYNVTITDGNGCNHTDSVIVNNLANLTASVTGQSNASCNGSNNGTATVTESGGTAPYTYSWNTTPVQNTATATGLAAGPYTCTVTDSSGCTYAVVVNISEPPILTTSQGTVTNVSCFAGNNGEAIVTVSGGTAPYSFVWNTTPAQTTDTATGLIAGNYSCTVTDTLGCVSSFNVNISEPTAISVATTSSSNISCFGGNNGTITVNATGGTGTLSYSWNTSPVQNTATASGLIAGSYTVNVTDANNCTVTYSDSLSEPSVLTSSISGQINACAGGNTGSATTTASGGTVNYSYSWNTIPVQTAATAVNLPAGNYTCTVTDANNCTSTSSVTISNSGSIALTQVSTDATCSGYNDGTATVTMTAGTAPYNYVWSNNAGNVSTITGLSPNTYTVSITDSNNCTASASFTITEPIALSTNAGPGFNTCSTTVSMSALINANETGIWSFTNGSGMISNPTDPNTTVDSLSEGNNIIMWTITDGTCFATDTVLVIRLGDLDCLPSELDLPSGYTPNGDGENDTYVIHGIEFYPENIFKVFNRWGNEVYSADNYKQGQWIGDNNQGDLLPDGTYFVILSIKNSEIKKSTYVDLRK